MMEARAEVVEGFMGSDVPVVKLYDGSVEFWVPIWEFENVAHVLLQAAVDYPWKPSD